MKITNETFTSAESLAEYCLDFYDDIGHFIYPFIRSGKSLPRYVFIGRKANNQFKLVVGIEELKVTLFEGLGGFIVESPDAFCTASPLPSHNYFLQKHYVMKKNKDMVSFVLPNGVDYVSEAYTNKGYNIDFVEGNSGIVKTFFNNILEQSNSIVETILPYFKTYGLSLEYTVYGYNYTNLINESIQGAFRVNLHVPIGSPIDNLLYAKANRSAFDWRGTSAKFLKPFGAISLFLPFRDPKLNNPHIDTLNVGDLINNLMFPGQRNFKFLIEAIAYSIYYWCEFNNLPKWGYLSDEDILEYWNTSKKDFYEYLVFSYFNGDKAPIEKLFVETSLLDKTK